MPADKDQNNKYKAAVGKRNVGSDPSKGQMDNAKNTSIGRIRGTIKKSSNQVPVSNEIPRMTVPRGVTRGSWEGYQSAPRADIALSGSGYSNPAAQKARYSKKGIDLPAGVPSFQRKAAPISNNITDYRNSGNARRNSVCLMKHRTKPKNIV